MSITAIERSEFEIVDNRVLHDSRTVVFLTKDLIFIHEDMSIPDSEKIFFNFSELKDFGINGKLVPKFKKLYETKVIEINYLTKLIGRLIEQNSIIEDEIQKMVNDGKDQQLFSGEEEAGAEIAGG